MGGGGGRPRVPGVGLRPVASGLPLCGRPSGHVAAALCPGRLGDPLGCGPHLLRPQLRWGCDTNEAPSPPPLPALRHKVQGPRHPAGPTPASELGVDFRGGAGAGPWGLQACGSGLGHRSLSRWPFPGPGGAHRAAFPGAWPLAGCSGPDPWPHGGTEGPTRARGDVEQTCATDLQGPAACYPVAFWPQCAAFYGSVSPGLCSKGWILSPPSPRLFCQLSGSWHWRTLCPPPGRPRSPARKGSRCVYRAHRAQALRTVPESPWCPPHPALAASQDCPGIRTRPWETSRPDPGMGGVDQGFWPGKPLSQARSQGCSDASQGRGSWGAGYPGAEGLGGATPDTPRS